MKVVTMALLIVMHLQVNAQLFSNNYMASHFQIAFLSMNIKGWIIFPA